MKRYLFFTLLVISGGFTQAQVVPNTNTSPPSVTGVHAIPSAYDAGMKVNFIRTWDATKPYTSESDVISGSRTIQEVKQTTQYFDGLGRPVQTVSKQVTPSGKDMVAPVLYDEFGREVYRYLPYVAIVNNTNDGKFKQDPFNDQASFFSNTTYNPGLTGEQVYYSKAIFESSPLNRVDTSFSPGNSWGGSHNGIVDSSLVNTDADSVRIWTIFNTGWATPTTSAKYARGTLFKKLTKDEYGKRVIEFTDKNGNLILKKVQIDANPSTHHTGWLCTYYVYDELNVIGHVIPPKAVDTLKNRGWQFESSIWNYSTIDQELCFGYDYNPKGTLRCKRIPGAGQVWMVYDARDRLVMSQDELQRAAGKWFYIKYDASNRPVLTGLWTTNAYWYLLEDSAKYSINYPNPTSNYEVLTQTYYDDYSWVSGTGLSSTFINTYATNTSYFYTASNSTFPYPQSITPSYITNGLTTGIKTKVLGTSTYLYTATFYDDNGRVIQAHSTNYSGGKDTITMQYDFAGKLLRSLQCHEKGGTNAQRYTVLTKNEYDGMGRLTKISKRVSNSPEVVLAENTYDELGQLQKKKIGQIRDNSSQNTYTSSAMDSLQYSYNIRGWLSGINKDYARAGNSNNWFGMELAYDFGFSQTQLNGNIAGIRWRSKGDGEQRAYGFTYDATNRFSRGDFTQYTSSAWNTSAGLDFTVKNMSYDANGNILTMTQKGWKLGGSVVIDSLQYGYIAGSNKLNYVTDKTNDSTSRLGDFKEYANNTNQDYTYDDNGNLTTDANKRIYNIVYNYLNLPDSMKVRGYGTNKNPQGRLKYVYDAAGNKLKKVSVDSTASGFKTTTTLYLGGFEYKNDTLEYISHEEGRIRPKTAGAIDTMYYDYFEKDQLGNIRVMLTDELKTDAYPAATMETANATVEEIFYGQLQETRDDVPNGYPANTPAGNAKVAILRGNWNLGPTHMEIGPGILLKVMSGDKFHLTVNSWWNSNSSPSGSSNPLGLNQLLGAIGGSAVANSGHFNAGELQNSTELYTSVSNFLNSQSYNSSKPKAFVNWILFDEQFNYVSSNSGYEQVGADTIYTTHTRSNMQVDKSGYLYVYVSNETPNINVYFDNLQVTHVRGPLVSEDHYYPFGLVMSGISSKSAGGMTNKKKFNGIEYNTDFDINTYEAFYRTLDPQIGRFLQLDPKPTDMESLYAAMGNNPIKNTDFLGDTTIFYTAGGVELLRTTENNKALGNAVTFVTDDNLKAFNGYVSTIGSDGGNLSEACSVQLLRGQGESYNTQSAFALVDGNAKNATPDKTFSPTDGKGPLINETSAAVEKKGGVFTVNSAKQDPTNQSPFSSTKVSGDNGVTIHTHDNEGRKFKLNSTGQTGTVLTGAASAGADNSSQQSGTGLFEMAVGKKNVYFYNASGVVLTISRDAFNPKYFKKQ